jgi:NAD(P)-dependent dehydrogenase (short-subunit alcohol dehydrogenase family)
VNIGSVGGLAGQEHAAAYCASKGGLELLTKAAALELADRGIRVVGIAPGDIANRTSAGAAEHRAAADLTRYARRAPVGRRGRPEDIAAAVLFAASDAAGFVTGTTIIVDGGMLAY